MPSIVLLALLATSAPASADEARLSERPNLLFFLTDDQRNDLLGVAGHPFLQTPIIDRLAEGGVRFENAFVTTSICAASRASILTGLYERTHKYTFGTPPIAEEHCLSSYPALLQGAGYRTGFIGKFGVGVPAPLRQKMFDEFTPIDRNPYFHEQPDGSLRHETDLAADHAIDFLQRGRDDGPFCLSISFNAPHAEDNDKENHYPWPPSADGLYEDVEIPSPPLSDPAHFEALPEFLRESMNRIRYYWRFDTPEKYEKNLRAYYRMITGIDHAIGRVLDELETLGLSENTVILFMSDNGYYLGERGLSGKWSHFEESLRVPLIVFDPRLPESKRGRVVDPIALNVDLAPTLLDLAGVDRPELYQGQSLVPLIQEEETPDWRTDFFCEHLFDNPNIPKWEGVRGLRWKYANYFEQDPPFEFLHDLQEDPEERLNLAKDPEHAEDPARLRARAEELRDQLGGKYSPEAFPTVRRLQQGN
ncbi:sulfatase [soil metagenome]